MSSLCFACDKKLGNHPRQADTRDDQIVLVGEDCYRRIKAAGREGYQPPKGGPRLYPILAVMQPYVIVTSDNPKRYHREGAPKIYPWRSARTSLCGLDDTIWNLYFIPQKQAEDRGLSQCARCYPPQRDHLTDEEAQQAL